MSRTIEKHRKLNGKLDITPRWLSLAEACRYASMSRKTLLRYVRQGPIYGTKKGGKWYIDRHSIDTFMETDDIFVAETVARLKGGLV